MIVPVMDVRRVRMGMAERFMPVEMGVLPGRYCHPGRMLMSVV